MKKKITRPDGTVVEYEGTAEELAELEREMTEEVRRDEGKSKGKRILNEERVMEMIERALEHHKKWDGHSHVFSPFAFAPPKEWFRDIPKTTDWYVTTGTSTSEKKVQ